MISTRFAPSVAVLVGLALVPTFIHSYAGMTVSDGLATGSVPNLLAGYVSAPTPRGPGWGKHKFESEDWIERKYVAGPDEVVLTVVRSYDLKRLYHHPELDVAYGTAFVRNETRRLSARPEVPVHLLDARPNGRAVAMYALHYDGRFVEDPILFQIRTAGRLLFSGRKPMTLFFAHDLAVPDEANPDTLPSARLLFAAIDSFLDRKSAAPR